MAQLTHYNSRFKPQKFPVYILADGLTDATNIGSLFRLADAFGVSEIFFFGIEQPISRKMKKAARSTEQSVQYSVINSTYKKLNNFKREGGTIIGLEITENSLPIHECTFSSNSPTLLILGNENTGISEEALTQCDKIVHINMHGANSSMNVTHAAAIALYNIINAYI